MPTRRSSPRRSAIRPTTPIDLYDDDDLDRPRGWSATVTPWLAVGAGLIAIVALAVTVLGRGPDLGACRSAAWAAVPDKADLPAGWSLSTTDLNANGMTVSVLGPTATGGSTDQPVIYASVTCYGDVAPTALRQYRDAATAAGATINDRGLGGDAYDVDNPTTGSVTTLFRVGGLIGQIADAGTAAPADLAAITAAVATAMGDRSAAGGAPAAANPSGGPVQSPTGSDEPAASDTGAPSAAAPQLEALLPTEISGTTLSVQSASAADGLGPDPNSRALAAAVRKYGGNLDNLQLAQATDQTGAIDLDIFGFRLGGGDGGKLKAAVIDSWLSAVAPGITQTQVKLAGKTFTKIDYGDGGRIDYVFGGADYVVVVETADLAIATEVAGKIK